MTSFDPIVLGPQKIRVPVVQEIEVSAKLVEIKDGDVLWVTLGMEDLGDGQGPWIPKDEEIQQVAEDLKQQFPEQQIVVAPLGLELSHVVRKEK